jgi:hypothetical protein
VDHTTHRRAILFRQLLTQLRIVFGNRGYQLTDVNLSLRCSLRSTPASTCAPTVSVGQVAAKRSFSVFEPIRRCQRPRWTP